MQCRGDLALQSTRLATLALALANGASLGQACQAVVRQGVAAGLAFS